jgi:phospholysine phosphohistidine inorganic pyrophosphate phosphatase
MGGIKGILFDLDGTIYQDGKLIPGADVAISELRKTGLSICFATNTTRKPRRMLAEMLESMNIPVGLDDVITAPSAAAIWLRKRDISRVYLLLAKDSFEDFSDFEITNKNPQAVVVGDLGDAWDFAILNKAFNLLNNDAQLVAVQKNRYWKTGDGLSLDAGPFVAALEFASGQEATIVGKPSKDFYLSAAASMGLAPNEILMVGDDLESDVGGAKSAGMRGMLVKTGKFQPIDLDHPDIKPDGVVESVTSLPVMMNVI